MPPPSTPPSACLVKVCGVRDPGEAAALDALGVDFLGFNFHPGSPRFVEPAAATPAVRGLKHAVPVGVFVDADPARVAEITRLTGIRYAQLHGSESWEYAQGLGLPVIKALRHARLADLGGWREPMAHDASLPAYLLIDTQAGVPGGEAFGGTGKVFDWTLLSVHSLPRPYFLAGGLGPDNLREALSACAPYAVDLNSKVELAPGRKDLEKVKACLRIVREFSAGLRPRP